MKDRAKAKPTAAVEQQLIDELAVLRRRVAELEAVETERKQAEQALRRSEEKYRTLVENLSEVIFTLDAQGRFTYISLAIEQYTGYRADEVIGQSFTRFIHPDDLPGLAASFERSLSGQIEPFEFRVYSSDGTVRHLRTSSRTLVEEGQVVGLTGAMSDITQHKQAEEALRQSEERYRTLVETAQDVIFTVAADGTFVSLNPAFETLTGWSRADWLGKSFAGFLHPEDRPVAASLLGQIMRGETPPPFELRINNAMGEEQIGELVVTPLIQDEAVVAVLGIARDVTERKRAEEVLQERERFLDNIFTSIQDGISVLDRDMNIIRVNPTMEEWYAHALPLVGKKCYVAYHGRSERCEVCPTWRTLQTGQAAYEVVPKRGPGGEIVGWLDLYSFPMIDATTGQMEGIIEYVRDITERKRAEEERERLLAQVQEQAQRVQEIMDTVPEGVLLLDSDCRVVLTNPLGRRDLAALAGAQVGDTLTRLGNRPLVELLTSPPKGLWHEVAADGRSLQVLARPVENDATPKGWVLVIRDVTQQYEAERRIQQQERLAAIGQLAAGIAHDFNNIMAVIVLHAQMTARSAALSDRDRGRLATINEQAHHATRLIQQILDFSRRAVLERQPLDLLLLLKEQVQLLKRTLPEHITTRLDYGHGEYTVNADPTRMQQMVMNLAVNARDAMPEGGILSLALERITVEPGASPLLPELEAGDWIRLSVADTGVGIPPEVLPHVFEPFYTTKPPDQGSGLGLAQVYGIVAQHEGRIDVETQVGAGTTFTIYLTALEAPPTMPLSPDVSIPPQGKGEVILVVEDNPSLRATLRETLTEWGYQVQEAANGVQALALLEELGGAVNLVLSDVVMPEMGGVALAHALRERGWVMPVILLSGYPQERAMAKLRAYGVGVWLSKPPSIEELAEAVAQALGTD